MLNNFANHSITYVKIRNSLTVEHFKEIFYLLVDAQVLQHAPRHWVPPPVGTHVAPGGLEHLEVVAGVLDDILDGPDGLPDLPDEAPDAADAAPDPAQDPVLRVEREGLLVDAVEQGIGLPEVVLCWC